MVLGRILTAPMRGMLWIFEEIHDAAESEIVDQAQNITHELTRLYQRLDRGDISEGEFESLESELLARLDAVRQFDESDEETALEDDEYFGVDEDHGAGLLDDEPAGFDDDRYADLGRRVTQRVVMEDSTPRGTGLECGREEDSAAPV
ncbi:MAG: gas vesicle protein GvpG [Deltaproteobacteria bacterium]